MIIASMITRLHFLKYRDEKDSPLSLDVPKFYPRYEKIPNISVEREERV